jgi:hypothetical protein
VGSKENLPFFRSESFWMTISSSSGVMAQVLLQDHPSDLHCFKGGAQAWRTARWQAVWDGKATTGTAPKDWSGRAAHWSRGRQAEWRRTLPVGVFPIGLNHIR